MGALHGADVLVTGGAGFIGSHLVERLVGLGARVRVLDNLSTGRWANLADVRADIELIAADIRDLAACRRCCQDVDFVFHLAALGSVPRSLTDPAETIAVNVGGTANVLAAAREAQVGRVVYASSSSVYGDAEKSPKIEGAEGLPLSPYAASKRMDEELAALFGRCFGLETVGVRFFNVYGPRQDPAGPYAAVIPRFFAALLARQPALIYGDGRQSRDFTFVGDAVAAMLAAAVAPPGACGCVFNVGSGRRTTLLELEQAIRELVGGGPEPAFAPPRPGDVPHSLAATEAAAAALGFRARVGLSEGLQACLAHYQRSREVPATPLGVYRTAAPPPGA